MVRKISLDRISSTIGHSSANMDILFETRVLLCTTWLTCVGVVGWLVSIATDYWVIIIGHNRGVQLHDAQHRIFLWSYSGLWRRCDILVKSRNSTVQQTRCHYHNEHDERMNIIWPAGLDFIHAELTCVVIVVAMIFIASSFSLYSLFHPRYVFKRLAGILHIMTTFLVMVVIEMINSESHIPFHVIHPDVLHEATVYYGYSYLLAWTVFTIYVVAGLAFLCLSKKRKFLKHDFNNMLK